MADLSKLAKLTELKYYTSQAQLQNILKEEQRLRDQIKKLDENSARAKKTPTDPMRSLGADMLWQAWVVKSKIQLNTELARILERKDMLLRNARKEYGKVAVSQKLRDIHAERERKEKQKLRLENVIEMFTIHQQGQ